MEKTARKLFIHSGTLNFICGHSCVRKDVSVVTPILTCSAGTEEIVRKSNTGKLWWFGGEGRSVSVTNDAPLTIEPLTHTHVRHGIDDWKIKKCSHAYITCSVM